MDLVVREMTLSEVELGADYFHRSPREHLDMLGVDQMRLPTRAASIESLRTGEYGTQSRTALAGYEGCHELAACMLTGHAGSRQRGAESGGRGWRGRT